jgi:prophage DNA circulation protein
MSSWRHHLHEYPHVSGGQLEKIGRSVARVRLTPVFDEDIDYDDLNDGIPLYPELLESLNILYNAGGSFLLVVPTIGQMTAMMTSLTRKQSAMVRSGEEVSMEFVQDLTVDASGSRAVQWPTSDVRKRQVTWDDEINAYIKKSNTEKTVPDQNLLDQIAGAVESVLAIVDSAELLGNQVASKIQQASQLVQRADKKLSFLTNPEAWRVVEAGKDLWSSLESLRATVQRSNQARNYVVPKQMALPEVSAAIFAGDAGRGSELLQQNQFEDSLAIPAGTNIRYVIL